MGLEVLAPTSAGAASVSINCQGITGDSASSLGDSKATLGLLSSIGSGGSGLSFAAEITTNAPAKRTPADGPFAADFTLNLTLPDSLLGPARDLLKLTDVTVTDATYAIAATGAASTTIAKTVPSQTLSLAGSPVVLSQSLSGTVTPTGTGPITYSISGTTRLTIAINKSVAGVQINALTVTCTGGSDIGFTSIQMPGSPTVTRQPLYIGGYSGGITGAPVVNNSVVPDNNNPLLADTLRVTSQPANGGLTATGGGAAFFLPPSPGLFVGNYDVCAASLPVAAVPGNNAVQTMTWPESYSGKGLNAHPLGMALQFKGEKTAPIPLAQWLGFPSPTRVDDADFFHRMFGEFVAPSPNAIRDALETLPSIGRGNVRVSARSTGGYDIEFIGALADAPQPAIEVVDWETWLPSNGLNSLLGLIPKGGGSGGGGGAPAKTAEQLDAELFSGAIGFDAWLDGRGKLLQADIIAQVTTPEVISQVTAMFPKAPELAVVSSGKTTIPATETGPLCTPFQISWFILPNPFVQVQAATQTRTKTVTRCSTKRVKVKGRYVRKRVCRKVQVAVR
ncbi:MAG: hypothetical protein GX868_04345 [Actinobacteria bacterium]|nr:hypothetical protein [Actinomycetota bacterium]